jgi:Lon protease-like protein
MVRRRLFFLMFSALFGMFLVVPLPHAALSLCIYEKRHKLLVRECITD